MSIIFFWMALALLVICFFINLETGSSESVVITFTLLLGLSIWGIASGLRPWEIEQEIQTTVLKNIDNSQFASFKDKDINAPRTTADYVSVNLNKLFETVIQPDQEVHFIKYKSGPYVGLYYPSKFKGILLDKHGNVVKMKVWGGEATAD